MAEFKNFLFHAKDSTGATGEWDFILDETGQISITQIVDSNPDFSGIAMAINKGQDLWNKIYVVNLESINFPERAGTSGENQYTFEFHTSDKQISKTIWANDVKTNLQLSDLILEIQNQIAKLSKKKPIF